MSHQSIYIASTEAQSGTMIISIGFMEMLKGRYKNVAFFRPVVPDRREDETHIDFMREHFNLTIPYESCIGFRESEVIQAFAQEQEEGLIEALISKVDQLQDTYDFVLIDGYPRNRFSTLFEFDINLKIAKNLGTVFCPILNAKGKNIEEISRETQLLSEMIREEGCHALALFVNRCDTEVMVSLQKRLQVTDTFTQIYTLPEVEEIDMPTLRQIVRVLNATPILSTEAQLNHLVRKSKIAAMGVTNYLSHIAEENLVIVPSDRNDIILASHLSYAAKNHPNIAGLILSGNLNYDPDILTLIKDFSQAPIPIFSVKSDSYETAIAIERIQPKLTAEDQHKITLVKGVFEQYINKEELVKRFRENQNDIITPTMFQYRLFEKARSRKQTIVLPESEDDRILTAASVLLRRDIVNLILLGEQSAIEHRCAQLRIDISKAEIIHPEESSLFESFSKQFYAMRKERGLTERAAKDAMTHKNYFATMLLHNGLADGMVSGAVHTTADTIRPALQIIKTTPGISIVSSLFFMLMETQVLIYGDCAVNLDPTAEALADIAIASADTATQFGIEPRVALLSYSTGDSGSGPDVEKVRKATKLAQQLRPDLPIEGPIQYDAAIDQKVAQKKLPKSNVAGRATVFIFPDLNTGNNTYKAVQRSTGAKAIGPILQGLRLPVNDLSRGCSIDDIVNTVAITAIQAQQQEKP
jgi:phosphate acetyltransferase